MAVYHADEVQFVIHVDPITELVDALDRDGKPALAWVVAWSRGGVDPVAAAWAVSRAPFAMVHLLERRVPRARARAVFCWDPAGSWEIQRRGRRCWRTRLRLT